MGDEEKKGLKQGAVFSVDFLETATRLVASGMTEVDIGYFLGITPAKIRTWKKRHPLFKQAFTDGKRLAKSYLIAKGLRAAIGYSYVEKNIKYKQKIDDKGVVTKYAAETSEFHKEMKPDSTLLMFLLCNISRQLKEEEPWISNHKIEIDQNKNINVKISGKVVTEQITRLAGAFLPKDIIETEFTDDKKNKQIDGRPKHSSGSNSKKRGGESQMEDKVTQ